MNEKLLEEARQKFDIDSVLGILFKKGTRKEVGTLKRDGRRYTNLDKKHIPSYRIIWMLHHGEFPSGVIDHINGNPNDNRIENLRLATCAMNQHNRNSLPKNNKTGHIGVVYRRGKFIALISKNKKQIYLGTFNTVGDAGEAYIKAKVQLHEGFVK